MLGFRHMQEKLEKLTFKKVGFEGKKMVDGFSKRSNPA